MITARDYWERAEAFGDDFNGSPCLILPNAPESNGYVRLRSKGRAQAHRLIYEEIVGPIPAGMTLDHECHNHAAATGACAGGPTCAHRACVNADHLSVKTQAANVLSGRSIVAVNHKKTACLRGHPLEGANLGLQPDGHRFCKTCDRLTDAAWKARNQERTAQYAAKFRAKNRASLNARNCARYSENIELSRLQQRQRYAKRKAGIVR